MKKLLTSLICVFAISIFFTSCNMQDSSTDSNSLISSTNSTTSSENSVSEDNALIIPSPSYAINLSFDSYEQMLSALTDMNSDEYKRVQQQLYVDGIDSDDGYELFKKTLHQLEMGEIKLAVPQINGKNMTIRDDKGLSKITFMSNELFRLPWMWFHCVSEADDDKAITVNISYLSVLENENISNAKSYLEVQNFISAKSPNPDNYSNFKNYTSVYEKRVILADGSKATALICEYNDDPRIYVKIYKDGLLIIVRANKDLLTDEFFSSFDVVAMN